MHKHTHTQTFFSSLKHIPNTRCWSTPVVLLAGRLLITYKHTHTHHLTAQTITHTRTHTHTPFTVKEKPVNIHTGCWLTIPNLVRGCCLGLDSKNLQCKEKKECSTDKRFISPTALGPVLQSKFNIPGISFFFSLSGFTFPNIHNQAKRSHESGYQ